MTKTPKNILFINPSYADINKPAEAIVPPLGMTYIMSYLEKHGIKSKIVDCTPSKVDDELLERIIRKNNPRIVGITSNTPLIKNALEVASLVKKCHPECIVVVGGPHATALPKETLEVSEDIDIIVVGEGEETFLELVQRLKRKYPKLEQVKGLAIRKEGKIILTGTRLLKQDLDELPFPARDSLPIDKYRPSIKWLNRTPFVSMMTSRGCPYKCRFCDSHLTFGRKTRFRSAENVVAEMESVVKKFGIKEILFYDDTLTLNRPRLIKICKLIIEKKLDITWGCLSRVNTIDEKILRLMKKAGCHIISFGLESGSPRMLELIKKGATIEQGESAVKLATKVGIESNGSFVFGMPGETKESMRQTIEWVRRVNPTYAMFFRAIPFPGTDVYQELVEQNKLTNQDWSNYLCAGTKPIIELENLTPEYIDKEIKRAWRRFYLRPSKIISYFMKIKSYYRLMGYLRGLRTFFQIQ